MIAPGSALSVARQAKLLGVSRSSVYYRPRPDSQEELDLLKRLDELFTENPVYGSRRLQQMLKREGVRVGRRRIRRLMRKLGLWAVGPKPDTSKPHPEHKVYPYLLRGLNIERPNHVWATDITYIRMPIDIKSGKVKTKSPAPALAYSSPVTVQTTGTTAGCTVIG